MPNEDGTSDALTLEQVDKDGALAEALDRLGHGTRVDFLRGSLAAGAGLIAALAVPPGARAAAARTANDLAILRFDLVLEYLQAGLYTEAERIGALPAQTLAWARVVGAHERAHIKAIAGLL